MRLAREAIELARDVHDQATLSVVLARSWASLDGSKPMGAELEPLLAEAASIAREAGQPEAMAGALTTAAHMAGIRGDRAALAAPPGQAARIRDALRRPPLNWSTLAHA